MFIELSCINSSETVTPVIINRNYIIKVTAHEDGGSKLQLTGDRSLNVVHVKESIHEIRRILAIGL